MGAEVMSDAPNKIWLQRPNRDPENEWHGEVTWCEDKQNDDDTCYIKASAKTTDLANQIERLTAELDKARTTIARMNSMESEHCADLAKELAECRKDAERTVSWSKAVTYICMDGVYAFIGKSPKEAFDTYRESTADHNSLDADELQWFVAEECDVKVEIKVKKK